MHFISAAALETLSQLSLQSLSPDPDPTAAATPGFGLSVLNIISADPFDEKIRLAAVVHFKNHVRSRWTPSSPHPRRREEPDQSLHCLPHAQSPPLHPSPTLRGPLHRQVPRLPLGLALLLSELVSNLRSAANYSTVNGLLGSTSSLFLKFRHSIDTSALYLDLNCCLDGFAAPLPEVFVKAT